MKKFITKIHYRAELNIEEKLLKWVLTPFSYFYLLGSTIRKFLYEQNIIKKKNIPAFVISVGNLTTGGTGKTPITVELAKYINNTKNKKTAILSRGYGGKLPSQKVNLISDGKNIFYTSRLAGDEPFWMAENAKNITVITGKNRYNSGLKAINELGCSVLILDDGFQHIKLERNLNILVVDCYKRFGNGMLLPSGPLREPMDEIERADKIILVNKRPFDKESEFYCTEYANYLRDIYDKPVYLCSFKNNGIFEITTQKPLNENMKIYAFAGIGQPEFFFNYLKEQGLNLVGTSEFTDHHLYTNNDLVRIIKKAIESNAGAIVTTEKDAVKISALLDDIDTRIDIFALKLGIDLNIEELLEDVNLQNA
jgi:tetraacyldisaccharide 4'-kinase